MGHPSWKKQWEQAHRLSSRFCREEDGNMTFLSLSIFVILLSVGGIGVDAMMAEMRRTQLQDTLDRAVLAAASLEQELDAQAVIEDYFEKSRLAGEIKSIEVEEGLGFKTVRASAETTFRTNFLHWNWYKGVSRETVDTQSASGDGSAPKESVSTLSSYADPNSKRYNTETINELTMSASSAAEERIGGVEISMVLDVSGSMNWNNRLPNLKVAAKEFVDTLTSTTEDGKLSVSIVPYATQVAAPETLVEHLNLTSEHTYSNCVNFSPEAFDSTSISPTEELARTMHFDPWNSSDGRDDDPKTLVPFPVCPAATDNSREIMVLQKNPTTLKSFIDDLWGGGNTSIDVGMKWGTALLDASMQPAIDEMIGAGHVSNDFTDRPLAFNNSQTLKVIVLMTDGQNTSQYYIDDEFRGGDSNIWWNDQEEKYSVYIGEDSGDEDNDGDTTEPMFYWPHNGAWKDHAYGEGVYEETQVSWVCRSYRWNGSCKRYRKVRKTVTVDEPGSAEIVTYADLWAHTTLKFNRNQHYYPWMNDNQANQDWYYDVRKYVGNSAKDTRTQAICDAAKEEGVVVFTIGFEAPTAGQNVLKNCASSISHYFDVDGLEIADAFAAIAASIRQLRLTQ